MLTPDLTAATLAQLTPVLECLLAQPHVNRPGLALSIAFAPGDGTVDYLSDVTIGDLSTNPYPNGQIARQKRDLSLRTRLAGDRVPPHMLRPGDSEWTGSAWLDGIAVGCAGLSSEQDGMVAHWVAHALATACIGLPLPSENP